MRNKRVRTRCLIMLCVGVIALSAALPVNAITYVANGYAGGSLYDHFDLGQSMDPHDLEMYPEEEIRIPLTADMFTYRDGHVPINMEAMTFNQLERVKVRTLSRAGSQALDYVQFDQDSFGGQPFIRPGGTTYTGTTTYISVIFAREFISTKDVDFDFTIYLSIDGKPYENELSIDLSGKLLVETQQLYRSDDYVNLGDGLVAEAQEFIPNIEVDLGNGVTMTTSMTQGKRYCGTAKVLEGHSGKVSEYDLVRMGIELPELYPEIAGIYQIRTIGLSRNSSKVRINDNGIGYHVYGSDFAYLGTTADILPYSDHYFVTTKRVPQFDAFEQYHSVSTTSVSTVSTTPAANDISGASGGINQAMVLSLLP